MHSPADNSPPLEKSTLRVAAAWSVHLLTASGAVWGLLAIISLAQGEWRTAFGWMVVAVAVDGTDGILARRVGVKEMTPDFDGAMLDNLVDYLTYVVVPAFFLFRAEVLPEAWRLPCAAVVCLASAYQFCQRDAKTADHFFRGFPSYWNIVALYSHYLELPQWLNLFVVASLVLLIFVPIKWIYPSRMERWWGVTMVVTLTWCAAVIAIVWLEPAPSSPLIYLSLLYIVYYVVASILLSRKRRRLLEAAEAVVHSVA